MTIKQEIESFKKDRIRGQAERLFYERGFRGTSMDAIAESLHATKPFLYGAYQKKTDILFDIHLRVVQRSLDAIDGARASPGTPTERLRRFALRLTDVTLSNQAAVAIFFREEASIPARQLRRINDLKGQIDDGIAALLAEGVAAGEFTIADTRTAALAIGGMISWGYTWYRAAGRLDVAAIAEHMADYALRIAGASATSSGPPGRRLRSRHAIQPETP